MRDLLALALLLILLQIVFVPEETAKWVYDFQTALAAAQKGASNE